MIKIDKTPPSLCGATTTASNGYGWYNSDVAVHFTATDLMSGLASVTPDKVISTEGLGQFATCTAEDQAGNTATYTVDGINIDKTAPSIIISSPTDGKEYLLNQLVLTNWMTSDLLSGIAFENGTLRSGDVLDTLSVGQKGFTVDALDKAGNTATLTNIYNVHYAYSGVLQPINSDGSSIFKLGSTVTVKFQLKDANGNIIKAANNPTIAIDYMGSNLTGSVWEAYATSAANIGNQFRYDDISQQYIYNLGTKGLLAGTWKIKMMLDDGTTKEALISLK